MAKKLVRNLIPSIIARDKERVPHFYYADDEEYWIKLKEKLQEEVHEFIVSENKEELADIFEVIDAILSFKKLSLDEINTIKEEKAHSNGTFSKRIILTSITKS